MVSWVLPRSLILGFLVGFGGGFGCEPHDAGVCFGARVARFDGLAVALGFGMGKVLPSACPTPNPTQKRRLGTTQASVFAVFRILPNLPAQNPKPSLSLKFILYPPLPPFIYNKLLFYRKGWVGWAEKGKP